MFQTCTDECDSPSPDRSSTKDFLAGDVCYVHESVEAPFHDLLISAGMEAVDIPSEIVQKARDLQDKMYAFLGQNLARKPDKGRPCVVMPRSGLSRASYTTDIRICLIATFNKTDDVFAKIDTGDLAKIISIWCLPVFHSSDHKIPIPDASRLAPQGHIHMLSGTLLPQSRIILRSFRSKNKIIHSRKKPGHHRFSEQQLGRLIDEEADAWRRWSERGMDVVVAEAEAFQLWCEMRASQKYDQGTPYPSTVSTKTSRSLHQRSLQLRTGKSAETSGKSIVVRPPSTSGGQHAQSPIWSNHSRPNSTPSSPTSELSWSTLSSPSEGPSSPSGQTRPPFPRGSPLKRAVQPLPETTSEDEPGEPEPEPMQIDIEAAGTSASVAGPSTENAGQASTPSPTDIVASDGEHGAFGKLIDSGRALVQNMGSRRRRRYRSKKANKKK